MKLTPPDNAPLSLLGRYVGYPIGKILLRILTLGNYPPEHDKHNSLFVALFSLVAIVFGFLIVDEWPNLQALITGN